MYVIAPEDLLVGQIRGKDSDIDDPEPVQAQATLCLLVLNRVI